MKIYYNPKLKYLSRKLRNESTQSEILLWNELKGKKIKGYQFMRQKPIGEYIVDFFCSPLKLIIEIDGSSHDFDDVFNRDILKQNYLESIGLHVLRFDDLEVKRNINNVIAEIEGWIESQRQPPDPL